jgi:hypothetical protein
MIWAFLAWYFLGGAGAGVTMLTPTYVDQLSDQVTLVVEDAARSAAAQQTLKGLRKEVKAFDKVVTKSGKPLTKSYNDHAANPDDTLEIFDTLNADWSAAQQRALDYRFELRESLTEDEWAKLFASPEQER